MVDPLKLLLSSPSHAVRVSPKLSILVNNVKLVGATVDNGLFVLVPLGGDTTIVSGPKIAHLQPFPMFANW